MKVEVYWTLSLAMAEGLFLYYPNVVIVAPSYTSSDRDGAYIIWSDKNGLNNLAGKFNKAEAIESPAYGKIMYVSEDISGVSIFDKIVGNLKALGYEVIEKNRMPHR